jgi:hypothetical protein
MGYDWSRTSKQELRSLYIDRGLDGSEIARLLGGGLTRSAVMGRLGRLGLKKGKRKAAPRRRRGPGGSASGTPGRSREAAPAPAVVAEAGPVPETAPAPVGPRGLVAAVEASDRAGCKAPSGDPGADGFAYCGAAVWEGDYCRRHAALFYRPPSGKERR